MSAVPSIFGASVVGEDLGLEHGLDDDGVELAGDVLAGGDIVPRVNHECLSKSS